MQIKKDNSTGYILEVDLEYPEGLHNDHSDYIHQHQKKLTYQKNGFMIIV